MRFIIPQWKAPKGVKAFSSTRLGGFSKNEFYGLNLGAHVGDDIDHVNANRQWIANAPLLTDDGVLTKHSKIPSNPIWLNQTHSTLVLEQQSKIEKSESTPSILTADGLFTQQKNIVCTVMTADCLPILLTSTKGDAVAAIHAGWKGLADGILENALDKFSGDVMAWIGPAIGAERFEVGEEVRQAFLNTSSLSNNAFSAIINSNETPQKWMANLALLATQRLNSLGVTLVYNSELCTYTDEERFYSYRRDGITGRQASFIWSE